MVGIKRSKHWMTPMLIIITVAAVIPIFLLIYLSLHRWELGYPWSERVFIGLRNYKWFFTSTQELRSLSVTFKFVFWAVLTEVFLAVLISSFLYKNPIGKKYVVFSMVIPIAMTPAVNAFLWRLYFTPSHGIINWILNTLFGATPNWFGTELAFVMLVLVDIWRWVPFLSLILLAGLEAIPPEPLEASYAEGATWGQTLLYVVVPMLKPIITVGIILRMIDAFKLFDLVFPLTAGGPGDLTEVLSMHIYRYGFFDIGRIGRASAMAVVLLVIVIALTAVYVRYTQRKEEV